MDTLLDGSITDAGVDRIEDAVAAAKAVEAGRVAAVDFLAENIEGGVDLAVGAAKAIGAGAKAVGAGVEAGHSATVDFTADTIVSGVELAGDAAEKVTELINNLIGIFDDEVAE